MASTAVVAIAVSTADYGIGEEPEMIVASEASVIKFLAASEASPFVELTNRSIGVETHYRLRSDLQ